MNIDTILTAFASVVTALGLQKAVPALVAYWVKRKKEATTMTLEHAKVERATAVEVEKIDLERERLVFSREQEFHRLETALREELQKDREELRDKVSAVVAELMRVQESNRQCRRQRQRLTRLIRRQDRKCRKEIETLKNAIDLFGEASRKRLRLQNDAVSL